jgi:DNA-binding transcriptional ArsR family regulator
VIDQTLRALAEPRRREIMELLRATERSASDIASHFDVSRPAISQHLAVLLDSGLVEVRRHGTRRFYRARPEGLIELRRFLESFWTDRLARLQRAAEAEERRSARGGGT